MFKQKPPASHTPQVFMQAMYRQQIQRLFVVRCGMQPHFLFE